MYMKKIWQSIIYCIWQLNGDASSSSLSLVWEFKVLVIIQSRKGQISLLAVQHLTWGWDTRCLCGWDPWISNELQPPTASSSNRWEGRFRHNIIAMCKGGLNSFGRLFLFNIHGGGYERWPRDTGCSVLEAGHCQLLGTRVSSRT